MSKFSQNLIDRFSAYFKEKYGISLTYEQAESYLDSLADFFIWVNKGAEDKAPTGAVRSALVILDSNNTLQENL